ncbi:MAG: hypothetical protein AB7J13_12720 [Pyrinomonadaceae bacterium]
MNLLSESKDDILATITIELERMSTVLSNFAPLPFDEKDLRVIVAFSVNPTEF